MFAVTITKLAVGLATQVGTGTLVGSIVKNFTPENLSTVKKVCVATAGIAASGLVGTKLTEYTDGMIDEVDDAVRKFTGKPSAAPDNK